MNFKKRAVLLVIVFLALNGLSLLFGIWWFRSSGQQRIANPTHFECWVFFVSGGGIWVRFPYPVSTRLLSQLASPAVGLSVSHDSFCNPQFSFQRLVLRVDCRTASKYVEASIRSPEANRRLACTASLLMTYGFLRKFFGRRFWQWLSWRFSF
jgi:hypothetical protein